MLLLLAAFGAIIFAAVLIDVCLPPRWPYPKTIMELHERVYGE